MKVAHAHALLEALDALEAIQDKSGTLAITGENGSGHGRLAGTASTAHDLITKTLIVAKVYTDDAVSEGALNV